MGITKETFLMAIKLTSLIQDFGHRGKFAAFVIKYTCVYIMRKITCIRKTKACKTHFMEYNIISRYTSHFNYISIGIRKIVWFMNKVSLWYNIVYYVPYSMMHIYCNAIGLCINYGFYMRLGNLIRNVRFISVCLHEPSSNK